MLSINTMRKLLTVLIMLTCSVGYSFAQKVRVIKATSQGWSGGVAGSYGTNYSIEIKSDSRITIDSIYVNRQGIEMEDNANGPGTVVFDSLNHTYTINAIESHQEDQYPDPTNLDKVSSSTTPSLRHYVGDALIIYEYKGMKQLYSVKQFQSLPPIDYP